MKNIHLNQASAATASFAVRRMIARLPFILLIQRFALVRLALLVILGIVALYIVLTLLYLRVAPGAEDATERPVVLQIEVIDELELWVEERQTERERVIIPGTRTYFKS